jgi:hypothetical protein
MRVSVCAFQFIDQTFISMNLVQSSFIAVSKTIDMISGSVSATVTTAVSQRQLRVDRV